MMKTAIILYIFLFSIPYTHSQSLTYIADTYGSTHDQSAYQGAGPHNHKFTLKNTTTTNAVNFKLGNNNEVYRVTNSTLVAESGITVSASYPTFSINAGQTNSEIQINNLTLSGVTKPAVYFVFFDIYDANGNQRPRLTSRVPDYGRLYVVIIISPLLSSPIQNATDLSSPIAHSWTYSGNNADTKYRIQVSSSSSSFVNKDGFSILQDENSTIRVNQNTANTSSYSWTTSATNPPQNGTTYYWSVRVFESFILNGITYNITSYYPNYNNYKIAATPLPTYTLSGSVKTQNNVGISGVNIKYDNLNATTDANGNYSFTVNSGWTGVITPTKSGYAFSPVSQSINNIASNQTLNFIGNSSCTNSFVRNNSTGGQRGYQSNAEINIRMINLLFNKNYTTSDWNNNNLTSTIVGRINGEVFEDYRNVNAATCSQACRDNGNCIHKGIDYHAPLGTPVFSPISGRVVANSSNIIGIYNSSIDATLFFVHVSSSLIVGADIVANAQIGSTDDKNHLHSELRNGNNTSAGYTCNTDGGTNYQNDFYDSRTIIPASCLVNTSVSEFYVDKLTSVYPNPTQGLFTIDFHENIKINNFTIYDISGKVVQNSTSLLVSNKISLDINKQKPGIYFFKANTTKGILFKKIVLQK